MTKPAVSLGVNRAEPGIGLALPFGLSLLLCLTLTFAAYDYVVPKVPNGTHGSTRRLGWYLHSGQWRADLRTLACAVRVIANWDSPLPISVDPPVHQLAAPASLSDAKTPSTSQRNEADTLLIRRLLPCSLALPLL